MIVPIRTRRHEQSIQGDGYCILMIALPWPAGVLTRALWGEGVERVT